MGDGFALGDYQWVEKSPWDLKISSHSSWLEIISAVLGGGFSCQRVWGQTKVSGREL